MVSRSLIVDYYAELGIDRYATSADIRTAYKRLALIWHPDRNKEKNAEEKFKKIKQVHDILIDDNRRREYDQQQVKSFQQQNTWFATTTNVNATRPNQDSFNLHTFEHFIPPPLDPFDILNDIQFFQESNFTSKMTNSPSYRNLYTDLFHTMNNPCETNPHMHSATPIYRDRLFRHVPPKPRSKPRSTSKRSSTIIIPTIHSTMANDRFLNELIDLYEEQKHLHFQPSFNHDPFINDLIYCESCQQDLSNNRTYSIHQEQQCQRRNNNNNNNNNRYSTIPSKSVRV